MGKPKIAEKSPLLLEMQPGTYYWCACGKSQNQPFCDGSHQGTTFNPTPISIEQVQSVFWCLCKHSANAPFCDGTHKEL